MAKANLFRLANLLIFGLTIFLVFCLVFESFMDLPNLVVWLGHWHPLILHFPIVLLLMAAILGLLGKNVPSSLLMISTISVLVTAVTGFFLATETSPKGTLVFWHQWLGTGMAILSVSWYTLRTYALEKRYILKGIQLILVLLVGLTAHYGGMITHGEDFLVFPKDARLEKIPENPLIYDHVVARVLGNNCVGCHNPSKKKGQLLMISFDHLKKGGKTGPVFLAGYPEKSELIRRIRLPLDHEEHMPPDGKNPLSEDEIKIMERWIALGASDTLRLDQLDGNEPLAALVKQLMAPSETNTWATLPKVADSTLQRLGSEYVTIRRIVGNSEALAISVFLPPKYDSGAILNLRGLAPNIVELDLSGLPIGVREMEVVALCKNLERLEVDRTPITDKEFKKLKGLPKLRNLKAYATGLTDESLATIKELKGLRSLYVWDTEISGNALAQIRKDTPTLFIDNGTEPEVKTSFVETDTIK